MSFSRRAFILGAVLTVSACGRGGSSVSSLSRRPAEPPLHPNETPELRRKINYWADHHQVPRALVHRVIIRESSHRPGARNGPYYGLMQILPQTARTMGYRGAPEGLLDADTNLQYAVKYLRGAYIVADGDHDAAVRWYARGYYYEARNRGLLRETGLRS
ncbi:MAG: lytic transglycosylase domain-containing protein [Paracoccus sp. (in: a-proteobacteria)]|nr:lytic transglycosylase domain-containing protein [Paracoccus sp. (in: a-proteobacteria)]